MADLIIKCKKCGYNFIRDGIFERVYERYKDYLFGRKNCPNCKNVLDAFIEFDSKKELQRKDFFLKRNFKNLINRGIDKDALLLYVRGEVSYKNKDFNGALWLYTTAAKWEDDRGVNFSAAWSRMGDLFLKLVFEFNEKENLPYAKKAYEEALSGDENNFNALVGLAHIKELERNFSRALRLLSKALGLSDEQIRETYGNISNEEINKMRIATLLKKATLLIAEQRKKEATEVFDTARKLANKLGNKRLLNEVEEMMDILKLL